MSSRSPSREGRGQGHHRSWSGEGEDEDDDDDDDDDGEDDGDFEEESYFGEADGEEGDEYIGGMNRGDCPKHGIRAHFGNLDLESVLRQARRQRVSAVRQAREQLARARLLMDRNRQTKAYLRKIIMDLEESLEEYQNMSTPLSGSDESRMSLLLEDISSSYSYFIHEWSSSMAMSENYSFTSSDSEFLENDYRKQIGEDMTAKQEGNVCPVIQYKKIQSPEFQEEKSQDLSDERKVSTISEKTTVYRAEIRDNRPKRRNNSKRDSRRPSDRSPSEPRNSSRKDADAERKDSYKRKRVSYVEQSPPTSRRFSIQHPVLVPSHSKTLQSLPSRSPRSSLTPQTRTNNTKPRDIRQRSKEYQESIPASIREDLRAYEWDRIDASPTESRATLSTTSSHHSSSQPRKSTISEESDMMSFSRRLRTSLGEEMQNSQASSSDKYSGALSSSEGLSRSRVTSGQETTTLIDKQQNILAPRSSTAEMGKQVSLLGGADNKPVSATSYSETATNPRARSTSSARSSILSQTRQSTISRPSKSPFPQTSAQQKPPQRPSLQHTSVQRPSMPKQVSNATQPLVTQKTVPQKRAIQTLPNQTKTLASPRSPKSVSQQVSPQKEISRSPERQKQGSVKSPIQGAFQASRNISPSIAMRPQSPQTPMFPTEGGTTSVFHKPLNSVAQTQKTSPSQAAAQKSHTATQKSQSPQTNTKPSLSQTPAPKAAMIQTSVSKPPSSQTSAPLTSAPKAAQQVPPQKMPSRQSQSQKIQSEQMPDQYIPAKENTGQQTAELQKSSPQNQVQHSSEQKAPAQPSPELPTAAPEKPPPSMQIAASEMAASQRTALQTLAPQTPALQIPAPQTSAPQTPAPRTPTPTPLTPTPQTPIQQSSAPQSPSRPSTAPPAFPKQRTQALTTHTNVSQKADIEVVKGESLSDSKPSLPSALKSSDIQISTLKTTGPQTQLTQVFPPSSKNQENIESEFKGERRTSVVPNARHSTTLKSAPPSRQVVKERSQSTSASPRNTMKSDSPMPTQQKLKESPPKSRDRSSFIHRVSTTSSVDQQPFGRQSVTPQLSNKLDRKSLVETKRFSPPLARSGDRKSSIANKQIIDSEKRPNMKGTANLNKEKYQGEQTTISYSSSADKQMLLKEIKTLSRNGKLLSENVQDSMRDKRASTAGATLRKELNRPSVLEKPSPIPTMRRASGVGSPSSSSTRDDRYNSRVSVNKRESVSVKPTGRRTVTPQPPITHLPSVVRQEHLLKEKLYSIEDDTNQPRIGRQTISNIPRVSTAEKLQSLTMRPTLASHRPSSVPLPTTLTVSTFEKRRSTMEQYPNAISEKSDQVSFSSDQKKSVPVENKIPMPMEVDKTGIPLNTSHMPSQQTHLSEIFSPRERERSRPIFAESLQKGHGSPPVQKISQAEILQKISGAEPGVLSEGKESKHAHVPDKTFSGDTTATPLDKTHINKTKDLPNAMGQDVKASEFTPVLYKDEKRPSEIQTRGEKSISRTPKYEDTIVSTQVNEQSFPTSQGIESEKNKTVSKSEKNISISAKADARSSVDSTSAAVENRPIQLPTEGKSESRSYSTEKYSTESPEIISKTVLKPNVQKTSAIPKVVPNGNDKRSSESGELRASVTPSLATEEIQFKTPDTMHSSKQNVSQRQSSTPKSSLVSDPVKETSPRDSSSIKIISPKSITKGDLRELESNQITTPSDITRVKSPSEKHPRSARSEDLSMLSSIATAKQSMSTHRQVASFSDMDAQLSSSSTNNTEKRDTVGDLPSIKRKVLRKSRRDDRSDKQLDNMDTIFVNSQFDVTHADGLNQYGPHQPQPLVTPLKTCREVSPKSPSSQKYVVCRSMKWLFDLLLKV